MTRSRRLAAAASFLAYLLLACVPGRAVLAHLSTSVLSDPGDPLLSAAVLHWNATHVPYSAAWWQFPGFYPAADTLAFSEHFLGVSVVANPIAWITGDPLTTYNLLVLLTFPLCAIGMYALVAELTGSVAAAFIAGLAYGFAPYRLSQLPHLQMLVSFWAPFALLGLHRYLRTGRVRWVVVYAAAWLLQGLANGYALVFLSVFIGLWGLWFVVIPGRWRQMAAIVGATLVAAVPLLPILLKYVAVRHAYGFVRDIEEIRVFSADVGGLLCASPLVSAWGWVRIGCRPEGELFPGAAFAVLYVVGVVWMVVSWRRAGGLLDRDADDSRLPRVLVVAALVSAIVGYAILLPGGWRMSLGPFGLSAHRPFIPFAIAAALAAVALARSPRLRAVVRTPSTLAFYVVAVFLMWQLALGPTITVLGRRSSLFGPFSWLLLMPGVDGLRVPARFWQMAVFAGSIVVGFVVAGLLRRVPRPSMRLVAATVLGIAVLSDGWTNVFFTADAPPPAPAPSALRGAVVLELPMGEPFPDIAAQYRAVTGGWRTVNGYSGYYPPLYGQMVKQMLDRSDALFARFTGSEPLDVIVDRAAGYEEFVARQPGATLVARSAWAAQYHLPRRR